MDPYVVKDGKKLRCGYTTGSCAAAAAKAAAWMLFSGKSLETISLLTPGSIRLTLHIMEINRDGDSVSCAVKKDSGDDPDITNGALIFASVSRQNKSGICIEGGKGVGRVTKPGLDQPEGAAAINSVPRQMIRENVEEICRLFDYHGGLTVVISVPDGEELAKKTFNPRLGIIGGISILGTSGIVEPMSDKALIETIRLELQQRKLNECENIILTPGNYGVNYIQNELGVDLGIPVMVSNFIGETLDICSELAFQHILLIGHIGKLVKIAGNMMNTHSRYGDCRMEIIASHAAASGLSSEKTAEILECAACDEALRILYEADLDAITLRRIMDKIYENLKHRLQGNIEIGVIMFSNKYGCLCETENAGRILHFFKEV